MNNIIKYITVIALSVTVVSCNKWLDVKPKTQIDREAFYESEAGFKNAVVGLYVKMKQRALYGDNLSMTMIEFMAQNWQQAPGENAFKTNMTDFKGFKYDVLDVKTRIKNVYSGLYNVVVQANDILNYAEIKANVFKDPNVRNIVKGEALAVRALCHLDILRMFGQMPNKVGGSISLPYAEVASRDVVPTYDFNSYGKLIIRDLKAAADLLKLSDPIMKYSYTVLNSPSSAISNGYIENDGFAFRRTRLNYYAVKAIQARAHLYLGQKAEAYACAKEILEAKYEDGKSIIALDDSSKDYAQGNYSRPNDSFFALNIMGIADYADSYFKEEFVLSAASKMDVIDNDLFDNQSSDIRKQLWYEQVGGGGNTKQMSIKKYWQTKDKLESEKEPSNTLRLQVPMIRLAEVYLIAIESTTDLVEANLLMKRFKASRSLLYEDLSAEELDNEIVKEYRREFYAEGQMFFLYKRKGATQMLWRKDPVTPAHYIVPVPDTEINR